MYNPSKALKRLGYIILLDKNLETENCIIPISLSKADT